MPAEQGQRLARLLFRSARHTERDRPAMRSASSSSRSTVAGSRCPYSAKPADSARTSSRSSRSAASSAAWQAVRHQRSAAPCWPSRVSTPPCSAASEASTRRSSVRSRPAPVSCCRSRSRSASRSSRAWAGGRVRMACRWSATATCQSARSRGSLVSARSISGVNAAHAPRPRVASSIRRRSMSPPAHIRGSSRPAGGASRAPHGTGPLDAAGGGRSARPNRAAGLMPSALE